MKIMTVQNHHLKSVYEDEIMTGRIKKLPNGGIGGRRFVAVVDLFEAARVLEAAQLSFDMALRSAWYDCHVFWGPGGFEDWQWRLATLRFAFGGLGVYSAGDVLNYAFIASRLQSAALQTKLLRHVGLVAYGSTFDDALCVFNASMEIDFLGNPSEIAAPKLMKKMADIYFTRVAKDAESSFFLISPPDGLMAISKGGAYFGLASCGSDFWVGTNNERLFQSLMGCYGEPRCIVRRCYWRGVIGIKHRHNAVRDTLVDICFRSGISAGKEVDIGLSGDGDKALRPADIFFYLGLHVQDLDLCCKALIRI
ncbi:hypothetical protein Tco_0304766 [Tanacetum coccineum]